MHTRPDIVFKVNYQTRFMRKPHRVHFSAVKRLVRYLVGLKDYGLWYSNGDEGVLEAFSDSDWGIQV